MRARGFTLVELVCVIAIIAVLAATAMLRFIDLSEDAEAASVAQQASAFATAVRFVQIKYILSGRSGDVDNLAGFGDGTVDTNASGYPTDTANGNTIPDNPAGANRCRNVFNGILAANVPACGGAVSCTASHAFKATTIAAQTCRFDYIRHPSPPRYFVYSASSGTVAVTNP
jgi:MSHA pilin protein MshB